MLHPSHFFNPPPDKGCSSPVGMNKDTGNFIKLNVEEDRCYKIGTIMHETLHSMGFGKC
jgi:hypothetical protein